MNRTPHTVATWLILVGLATLPAHGGQRIESYYFPGPELQLQSRWLVPHLRATNDPQLNDITIAESAFTELRLVIPPAFVGKRVRVDVLLPAFAQGVEGSRGLEVEWRTQGVFRPGKLRMGERVPLFEGVASGPLLSDRVAYIIHSDARYVVGPIRFETVYEIEETP
jgi:hypothetical protein